MTTSRKTVIEVKDLKTAYATWRMNHSTGERYWQPISVSEYEATAIRLGVNKSPTQEDSPISEVDVFWYNGTWYGPVDIVKPNDADLEVEAKNTRDRLKAKKKQETIEKLIAMGATEEDIKTLQETI